MPLEMGPQDAFFIVFAGATREFSAEVTPLESASAAEINTGWDITFGPERGAAATTRLSTLQPLSENIDLGIRYYSGVAIYTTRFTLPRGADPGEPLLLDLGAVDQIAEVRVNGTSAGFAWTPQHRVDIAKHVKHGRNRLEVRVANTWVNRFVVDAQPGATKIAFSTLPTYKADAPLLPSGLIGPMRLLAAAR